MATDWQHHGSDLPPPGSLWLWRPWRGSRDSRPLLVLVSSISSNESYDFVHCIVSGSASEDGDAFTQGQIWNNFSWDIMNETGELRRVTRCGQTLPV